MAAVVTIGLIGRHRSRLTPLHAAGYCAEIAQEAGPLALGCHPGALKLGSKQRVFHQSLASTSIWACFPSSPPMLLGLVSSLFFLVVSLTMILSVAFV